MFCSLVQLGGIMVGIWCQCIPSIPLPYILILYSYRPTAVSSSPNSIVNLFWVHNFHQKHIKTIWHLWLCSILSLIQCEHTAHSKTHLEWTEHSRHFEMSKQETCRCISEDWGAAIVHAGSQSLHSNSHTIIPFSMPEKDAVCPNRQVQYVKWRMPKIPWWQFTVCKPASFSAVQLVH